MSGRFDSERAAEPHQADKTVGRLDILLVAVQAVMMIWLGIRMAQALQAAGDSSIPHGWVGMAITVCPALFLSSLIAFAFVRDYAGGLKTHRRAAWSFDIWYLAVISAITALFSGLILSCRLGKVDDADAALAWMAIYTVVNLAVIVRSIMGFQKTRRLLSEAPWDSKQTDAGGEASEPDVDN